MYKSTKLFREFPSAYRNPNSKNDCYLLHGYCRDFYVEFTATELDKAGFVFDFGGLREFKQWLEEKFDHTVILQADDPYLEHFRGLEALGVMKVVTLPLVSCEGFAQYVGTYLHEYVQRVTRGRVSVSLCECFENAKNSGQWHNNDSADHLTFAELELLAADLEGE